MVDSYEHSNKYLGYMKGVNLSTLSASKEAIHFFKEIRGAQNNMLDFRFSQW
jgi:hypothetical protein